MCTVLVGVVDKVLTTFILRDKGCDMNAIRICLGCDKGFNSRSNGNRFCEPCACKKNRRSIKITGKISPLESGQDFQRNALALHYQRNVVNG